MKKFLLFISFCLMATVYNVASAAEEVLWAEDFSSYAANAVPKGGDYNYACTLTGTKVYTNQISAGAPSGSPELLIAKSGGIFSATIPLNGKSGNMTLSFYTNDAKRITITATGATLGENTYSNNLCTYPVTVAEGTKNLTLEFKNTNSKNVRFDDVKLFQIIEGEPTEPTQVATPTFSPASGTSVKYGSTVTVSSDEGTKLVVSYGDVLLEEVGTNKKDITLPDENSGKTEYIIETYAVDINGKLGDSETAKATYTLYNENVADIAAFLTAADAVNARTIKSDATVVWKESNKKLYVKDHSGWLLLYSNAGAFTDEYINGDVIKAGYKGTYLLSKNNPEMSEPENIVKGEAVDPIAPTEVSSLTDYDACFCNEYIVLKKVTLNASNSREVKATFEDGSTVIVYSSTAVTYDGTKFYDVEGFKLLFNDIKEVTPKEIRELSLPALAVFTDENDEPVTGGIVKQGSYINYSWESGCSAKVYYNDVLEKEYTATEPSSGSWYVDAKTYAAGDEVTIKIEVTNESGTTTATATFTVANPYKVVDVITVDDLSLGQGYTNFSYAGEGAVYAGRCQNSKGIYINNNKDESKNAHGAAFFMTESVGVVSKITLDVLSTATDKKIYVYGQYEPYEAYEGTDIPTAKAYMYSSDATNLGTKIGESGTGKGVYTFDNPYKFNYIMIISDGSVTLSSITFEWEDAFEYGDDIAYEMQSETTKLTAGKFVTLVDATNKIAVSRNNAAEGTIAGAAASIAEADENSKTSLTLGKGQFSIDEFELVPAEGGFKLYGGGSITRRYIGVDATGLTTTADENDAAVAVVTLESDGTGVVVKFADGDIIVSDGTNFGKGKASTESATSLAGGATLVPAYVFVSPGEDSTGVEDIEMVETEAPAQYYNLNGVEVKAGNLVPGIYIVRQGNKVSKQFIR